MRVTKRYEIEEKPDTGRAGAGVGIWGPAMSTKHRTFVVQAYPDYTVNVPHVLKIIVVIHLDVFDAVDDEWRSVFYELHDAHDIMRHLIENIVFGNSRLSQLDGFANFPDSHFRYRFTDSHILLEIKEVVA